MAEEDAVVDAVEGESNMKLLSSLIGLAIVSITLSSTVQGDNSIQWINDRDYSVSILDNSNRPILSIVIKYQGKTPYDNQVKNHNWKSFDTDFYRESFTNLTDSTIHIQEIRYFLDRGKLHTSRIKGKEQIKALYGTTRIIANESLHRNDAWIWAKKDNKLHRMFLFTYNDEKIEVDIPLVYQQ